MSGAPQTEYDSVLYPSALYPQTHPDRLATNAILLGLKPAPGQTHQEASGVKVLDEFHQAVCVLARKLAKGIFYRETGTVFPDEGCLLLNWFTNSDLLRDGKYPAFDLLKEIGGNAPPLQRTGKYLNDQFEYEPVARGNR